MQILINIMAALLITMLWLQLRDKRKEYIRMRDICIRMEKGMKQQGDIIEHYKTIIRRLWDQLPPVLTANPKLDFAHPSRVVMDEAWLNQQLTEDVSVFKIPVENARD